MTRSREYFQENKDVHLIEGEDLPFKNIIGKINQIEPPEFDRGRKLRKPSPGIREFTQTISNPLYRNYNPRGYIKNDDEIAREFIKGITHTFNQWLGSFDGDLVQLDPDVMIKILRDDLEHSFQHSTLEENQPEPVAYKSRFRFDQPSITLDLGEE
ncbi:unnamed protein product [Allacma fusca]|uniref:Uncharacterized protein n=1 Tax=Allacma fusca TaxID=39272 RepID=A0A8J2P298_9HEXA|nr:unnamed protein product [Allacma fusca]